MFRPATVIPIVLCALALTARSEGTRHHTRRHKPLVQVTQLLPESAPTPQPPPPPLTPEQGPSSPPEVTFKSGQLTITARNSTMSDVLNTVKQMTGAAVDMPAVTNERVVGQFGPGAPRDVMAQLLNGSHYDYVLAGSPSDPGALNKVVLTARVNGPEPAPPNQPQVRDQPVQVAPDVVTAPNAETYQTTDETQLDFAQTGVAQQQMLSPDLEVPPEQLQAQPAPGQQQQQNAQPGAPPR